MHGANVLLQRCVRVAAQATAGGQRAAEAARHAARAAPAVKAAEEVGDLRLGSLLLLLLLLDGRGRLATALLPLLRSTAAAAAAAQQGGAVAEWWVALAAAGRSAAASAAELEPGGGKAARCTTITPAAQHRQVRGEHAVPPLNQALRRQAETDQVSLGGNQERLGGFPVAVQLPWQLFPQLPMPLTPSRAAQTAPPMPGAPVTPGCRSAAHQVR